MLLGIRWGNLYTKIIVWVFVPVLVILFAVALVTYYAYEQVTESLVIARDRELVRLSASQLATELTEYTNLLTFVARAIPPDQPTALSQSRNRLVIFDGGVVMLNTFGVVVAAEPNRPDILQQDWSDRAYFRQMARSPRSIFSGIVTDGWQGRDTIALAVPITGNRGEFLGTLIGMFHLGTQNVSAFYGSIVKLRLGQSGDIYLVDDHGRVIYHSDVNRIGEDFSTQPVVQQALAGKAGAIRITDPAGRNIVAGFAPVPNTPWTLVTEENWTTLTNAGQGYRIFLIALLALGVIVPSVVVTLGIRRITQPIEDLTEAAQEVAKGNFGQVITAPTGDEIEKLAEQFNLMSVHLQESYAGLEQRVADRTKEMVTLTKQFAILNAIQASVNESLDLSDTLNRVLDETMGLLNLEVGEIRLLDEGDEDLIIRTQQGLSPEFVRRAGRQPVAEFLPKTQAQSGEPLFIEDVSANSYYPLLQKEGLQAAAIFPLRAKDSLLGTLTLATRRGPRTFSRNERELLRAVSDQAAVAIENAQLYAETSRRVDEIQTVFAVQQAITSRLDTWAVLQLIADEARRLTGSRGALVFMLEEKELRLSVLSTEDEVDISVGYRMPVTNSLTSLAFQLGQPLRLTNVQRDSRSYTDLVQRLHVDSLMIVPLMSGPEPIGSISIFNKMTGAFGLEDERVLTMLASGAVIGLENARLYQEEQARRYEAEQRRHVAESLRDILTVLNSNRPLEEILHQIVKQASRLLGANAVAIYRLQSKEGPLKVQAAQGLPAEYIATMEIPVGEALVGRAVLYRQPVAVSDIRKIPLLDLKVLQQDGPRWELLREIFEQYYAILAVPLIVKDEVYGGIVLYYNEAREFLEEEVGLAVTFANQVALAIENARLFGQAEQAAILEERQRLARELHDSVTQALYGVTMFAEASSRLLTAGKIDMATDHLNELRGTAQEALQEMRLLLFELRPPLLEEEGLAAALQTRLEAVERRSGLETELKVEGEENSQLPPKIEDGLYRIAQEALNNALKHAQARHIRVSLRQEPQKVTLEICDDGRGFDLAAVRDRAGMGLRGMEERVAQLGAHLTIDSQPDQGTKIKVEVQP